MTGAYGSVKHTRDPKRLPQGSKIAGDIKIVYRLNIEGKSYDTCLSATLQPEFRLRAQEKGRPVAEIESCQGHHFRGKDAAIMDFAELYVDVDSFWQTFFCDHPAVAFANDQDAPAVLIAAIGPGLSQTTLKIYPDRKLRSLFGRSVRQADGS